MWTSRSCTRACVPQVRLLSIVGRRLPLATSCKPLMADRICVDLHTMSEGWGKVDFPQVRNSWTGFRWSNDRLTRMSRSLGMRSLATPCASDPKSRASRLETSLVLERRMILAAPAYNASASASRVS